MIRIALVDDSQQDIQRLKGYVERYAQEHNETLHVQLYPDGLEFLEHYKGAFDIIFMDVEMPHLNGIDVARKLREIDSAVALIFVTNMAQYAICGYEVNAIDYMVKPVSYFNFVDKLTKAIGTVKRNRGKQLLLHSGDGLVTISVEDIDYVERDGNHLVFHSAHGEFRERGAVAELAKRLEGAGFAKCTAGCLVNLSRVVKVNKDTVWVGATGLPLARPQKKEFTLKFVAHLGGVE